MGARPGTFSLWAGAFSFGRRARQTSGEIGICNLKPLLLPFFQVWIAFNHFVSAFDWHLGIHKYSSKVWDPTRHLEQGLLTRLDCWESHLYCLSISMIVLRHIRLLDYEWHFVGKPWRNFSFQRRFLAICASWDYVPLPNTCWYLGEVYVLLVFLRIELWSMIRLVYLL